MNQRTFVTLGVSVGAASLCLVAAYRIGSAAPQSGVRQAAQPAKPVSPKPVLPGATNTDSVVDAANAFLATLSDAQKATALPTLTSQNVARWSNFPAGFVPRNGLFLRDLNPAQTAAALSVARAALSTEGFNRFQEIRATDDAFAKTDRGPGGGPVDGPPGGDRGGRGGQRGFGGPPPGGGLPPGGGNFGGPSPGGGFGGPGGGQNIFGNGNYIIAFLGKPSKTAPWLLQLGGHHLAFNLYYNGKTGTATPYFVGAQPNIWKDASGKTHAPLAPMRDSLYAMLKALTPEQNTRAHLSGSFHDVLVGPGQDGRFPTQSDGVLASDLNDAAKTQLKKAIAAWAGDNPQGAVYRKRYEAELTQTKVSYSGTTNVSGSGDYVRIDGPHVWIEFVCQGSDHYHTIWRDKTSDYGAEFSF